MNILEAFKKASYQRFSSYEDVLQFMESVTGFRSEYVRVPIRPEIETKEWARVEGIPTVISPDPVKTTIIRPVYRGCDIRGEVWVLEVETA